MIARKKSLGTYLRCASTSCVVDAMAVRKAMRIFVALLCLALAEVELASAAPKEAKQGHRLVLQSMRNLRQRRPPPPPPAGQSLKGLQTPTTHWFDQLLDHFDPTINVTWQQRYFANPSLYEEEGPVFIFIEGEAEARSKWIAEGGSYMYSLAEVFKAKMYVLEHRFFGQSKPTPNITTENLRWLSPDQALADLAYFIEYLIGQGEVMKGQKLAVFGGSYPGNLAAWARIKYPHLVHAAVASSAPVHAEENFPEYMEVVTRSIRKIGGYECADNIEKANKRIQKLLLTTDGLTQIQDLFYMCSPPDPSNKLDMDLFYEVLANPFAGAAQYNRDGVTQYSLKAQCEYMAGDLSDDEAVQALANVFVASQGGFIWDCVDLDYDANTEYLKITDYTDGSRQWVYMTCTSFGYFQTADGDTVFPKGYFDLPYFLQQCKDAFGDQYDDSMAKKGVTRTNTVFGDWNPDETNVMFVNGEIDPWHALGVLKDINDESPAILLSSTSHCYDMYADQADDPDELREAREKIKEFVRTALYGGTSIDNPTLPA